MMSWVSFVIVSITGSILHFAYGWSNQKRAVGIFTPINESTWEHLKLLFYPCSIVSLIEYFFFGWKIQGFLFARLSGILLGMLLIVVFFYTYSGIIGRNYLIMDIFSFLLGVGTAYFSSHQMLLNHIGKDFSYLGWILLFLLTILFTCFTFSPPHFALFKDPIHKTYGLSK